MSESEEWRPVPGYEGFYEASNEGRVRSVARSVRHNNSWRRCPSVVLAPRTLAAAGHLYVNIYREGNRRTVSVHGVVMRAFRGLRPDGMEVRHLDGNPTNNVLENLAYGTHQENMLDRVRHGTDSNARKTHCHRGHEFTPENTWRGPRGGRTCRSCSKARKVESYRRRRAAKEVTS